MLRRHANEGWYTTMWSSTRLLSKPPVGPGSILSSLRRLKNEQIYGLSHPSQGGRAVQRIDDAFCMELVK